MVVVEVEARCEGGHLRGRSVVAMRSEGRVELRDREHARAGAVELAPDPGELGDLSLCQMVREHIERGLAEARHAHEAPEACRELVA